MSVREGGPFAEEDTTGDATEVHRTCIVHETQKVVPTENCVVGRSMLEVISAEEITMIRV